MGNCLSLKTPIDTSLSKVGDSSTSQSSSLSTSNTDDHQFVTWTGQSADKPITESNHGLYPIQYHKHKHKQIFNVNIHSPGAVQIGNKNTAQNRCNQRSPSIDERQNTAGCTQRPSSIAERQITAGCNQRPPSMDEHINHDDNEQNGLDHRVKGKDSPSTAKTRVTSLNKTDSSFLNELGLNLDYRNSILRRLLDELRNEQYQESEKRQRLREFKVTLQEDFDTIWNKIESNVLLEDKLKHLFKQSDYRATNHYVLMSRSKQ